MIYYFDIRDGIPQRDRDGRNMASPGAAIEHSKEIARTLRDERPMGNARLVVVVLDEMGSEIHREKVYLETDT